MPTDAASTASIDYIQRSGAAPQITADVLTRGELESRRLLRVAGVGKPDKGEEPRPLQPGGRWRPRTAELLTGMYGYRIPLVFQLVGSPDGLRVQLGTWSARGAGGAVQDRRIKVMESVLRGLYSAVDLEPATASFGPWPLTGIGLGVPAPTGLDAADGGAPVDRIARSMAGTRWSVIVLAHPVSEKAIGDVRSSILNEMRAVGAAAVGERAPSPLTDQYLELLRAGLASAGEGMATGAWRTAVYLLGDEDSYPSLASAWRSLLSGGGSLPEPVRVFDDSHAEYFAREWAMPDQWGEPGPGRYLRPFEVQTLLATHELAAMVHLPELEAPGFHVDLMPRFDVVVAGGDAVDEGVRIGHVVHNRLSTPATYDVSLRSLTRHVFVAGTTGSGKTNTIMSLLAQTTARGVPFLVIEPAKTEYRSLLEHPELGSSVRVFTPGRERVAPLRLNPFEVPPGADAGEHLDLLRAVFAASFAMWGPLPHVLERCLHEVYEDAGWDLRTNRNARTDDDTARAGSFPTLADVSEKVKQVVPTLGYEPKLTDDIRAAMLTRLDSLRSGGKGAMLDVSASVPIAELLTAPTVIELEGVGDDDDKAFLIGLLLIRLTEYRRAAGPTERLTHLLVIEEAHRLLTNVTRGSSEYVGDPRGQAVETFTNLLSEIRAYGQGVLIADQVPVRLAPDVIKNTNLKLAHRIVAADDRAVLGGTMAMTDAQARFVATLGTGRIAAFSEGDDAPVLVAVPRAKGGEPPPSHDTVHAAMARWQSSRGLEALYRPRPFCAETCADGAWACELARRLLDDNVVQRTVARMALSTAENAGALDRIWPEVVWVLRARRPERVEESTLLLSFAGHAADWYAARRGGQGRWSYTDTDALAEALREVLLEKVRGAEGPSAARERFQERMRALHRRTFPPYQACDRVCAHAPLCIYRAAVGDLVRSRRYHSSWQTAESADASENGGDRRANLWRAAWSSAYELVELPHGGMPDDERESVTAAARRASLCFAQQMVSADDSMVPRTAAWVVDRILAESGVT